MISTLQFEPEQGSNNNTVTVTCSAITGRASRSTTITVAAKDTTTYPTLKKTISVTQTGKPEFIIAAQGGSTVDFAATVTTFSISGSSNSAKLTVNYTPGTTNGLTATLSKLEISSNSGTSWTTITSGTAISGDPGNTAEYMYRATFTCSANTSVKNNLTGTVNVSSDSITSATTNIVQDSTSATLSVSKTSLSFNATAGTATFDVTSNTAWTVASS